MSWPAGGYGRRRRVDGGLRAQSRRGPIARTWWGKQFVAAMEGIADTGRLARGRNYARTGQVLSVQFETGRVTGIVQGSQLEPFTAQVLLAPLRGEERAELVALVRSAPGLLSALISGEVPRSLGPILLPATVRDLDFECTCPDDGWPCKHAAAVLYLVAEELDLRPVTLLKLRGLTLDELIGLIDAAQPGDGSDSEAPAVFYGDETVLPPLPPRQPCAAIDELDADLLDQALSKAADTRESASMTPREQCAAAQSTLRELYRTLVEPSGGLSGPEPPAAR
jgi:uncharacterized Zn finger protein